MNRRLPSYCLICEAPEGRCSHDGPRFLDPPRYRLASGDTAAEGFVWVVSPEDSARMESGSGYGKGGIPKPTPIPQPHLLELIETRVFVSDKLIALLDDSYAADAQQTSHAIQSAVEAYDSGRFTHLGGVVVNRLREIVKRGAAAT